MRTTHRLGTGQLAVEIAPDFFKMAGEPVRSRLEIDLCYGGAEPTDAAEDIDVSEIDIARKEWLADGQYRYKQSIVEKFRKWKGE